MKKVIIFAILMCMLCGCHRSVPTVEFEPMEFVEEETVSSVPEVYYCPPGQMSQHKEVNLDVGEVSDMSFLMEWIEVSIPQDAQLVSYYLYEDKLYYSYNFYHYLSNHMEDKEKMLSDEAYNTKLMCYDIGEKTTTEVISYPVNSEISRINVSGEYLSFNLWSTTNLLYDDLMDFEQEFRAVFVKLDETGPEEVELTNLTMTNLYFFSIADGMYALASNVTGRSTINEIAKINMEKDLVEYIILDREYTEVNYSKGYLICEDWNEELQKIDIYNLDGEYVMGFKVGGYIGNAICNDKICAWITEETERDGCLIYVYSYERDAISVIESESYIPWIECDGDRVYFAGGIDGGISCYDSRLDIVCKGLITGMNYQIESGEGKGIFGTVSVSISSTPKTDEEGRIVYSFYRIK